MIGHILLGMFLAHVLWGGFFCLWWLFLIRNSGEDVQQAIRDDFAAVRNAIRRAKAPLN